MKQLVMITYRYRDVSEENARKLLEKFPMVGDVPGVIAHYERLDGKGGFILQELQEDRGGPRKEWQLCHYVGLFSSQPWCSRSSA